MKQRPAVSRRTAAGSYERRLTRQSLHEATTRAPTLLTAEMTANFANVGALPRMSTDVVLRVSS